MHHGPSPLLHQRRICFNVEQITTRKKNRSDPDLNNIRRSISRCLMPTKLNDFYLLSRIAPTVHKKGSDTPNSRSCIRKLTHVTECIPPEPMTKRPLLIIKHHICSVKFSRVNNKESVFSCFYTKMCETSHDSIEANNVNSTEFYVTKTIINGY